MAAMTTVLGTFADNGNSRTLEHSSHKAAKPKLVIQKRRVPSGNPAVAEDTITVVYGTEDDTGKYLSQKIHMEFKVRRPLDGIMNDRVDARDLFREIIASDELNDVIEAQTFIQ